MATLQDDYITGLVQRFELACPDVTLIVKQNALGDLTVQVPASFDNLGEITRAVAFAEITRFMEALRTANIPAKMETYNG